MRFFPPFGAPLRFQAPKPPPVRHELTAPAHTRSRRARFQRLNAFSYHRGGVSRHCIWHMRSGTHVLRGRGGLPGRSARKRLGLLEKHKDYAERARDFHRKDQAIKVRPALPQRVRKGRSPAHCHPSGPARDGAHWGPMRAWASGGRVWSCA